MNTGHAQWMGSRAEVNLRFRRILDVQSNPGSIYKHKFRYSKML